MKRIAVLSWSDLSRDARVSRQIEALSKLYIVDTFAWGLPRFVSGESYLVSDKRLVGFHRFARRGLLAARQFEQYYWTNPVVVDAQSKIDSNNYELIVANDIDTLPLALKLGADRRVPVLFDAHEFSPAEFEESLSFRLFVKPYKHYLCSQYIPKVGGMLTVSPGLASRYASDYKAQPEVVYNAPVFHPRHEKSMQVPGSEQIKLVHHGASDPARRIDCMVEGVILAGSKFSFDLYLVPTNQKYMEKLKKYAEECDRIRIHPPVPTAQIVSTISQYDIGMFVYPASSFNQRYCLPNKFFDFIQARLPVLIAPLPDLENLTKAYDIGWIAPACSSEAIAETLTQIKIDSVKAMAKSLDVAAEELSFDRSEEVLLRSVERLLLCK